MIWGKSISHLLISTTLYKQNITHMTDSIDQSRWISISQHTCVPNRWSMHLIWISHYIFSGIMVWRMIKVSDNYKILGGRGSCPYWPLSQSQVCFGHITTTAQRSLLTNLQEALYADVIDNVINTNTMH